MLVPGSVVGGYRLVRRVTDTAGVVVWLARAPGADETVSVCVQEPTEALDRRIAAHGRISSPHVLALVDLATDGNGRVVLVTERTDWTLATLLASRARLAPGEAVTVLAPLAAGLAAIHAKGFTHGGLSPATVLFSPDGRPVIAGLESLRQYSGTNPAERELRIGADYRSLADLVRAVGSVVDGPAQAGFAELSGWIAEELAGGDQGSLLGQLECRLFGIAPALPVVLVADRRTPGEPVAVTGRPRRTAGVATRRATDALPGLLRRAVSAGSVSGAAGYVARVLRGRALALCVGIVLLVLTLIAGLSLIPDRGEAAGVQQERPAPTMSEASPAGPVPHSSAATGADAGDDDTIDAEDPVAATVALLERRSRCARKMSPTCVPGYAEAGSALAETDAHAFDGSAGEGLLLEVDGAASVVQHVQDYGDAALLHAVPANEKRQPVLILAVRTDTGWRLRDLFEPN